MLYLIPAFSSIKKVQQKKESWEKLWKKSWRSVGLCAQVLKVFHIKWVTSFYLCLVQILVGSDRNTCIPIILLVCIKSEISLRVCLIYLHHSYPVVSTRQRTSSLDCYLTLQQLDFRLYSLCITPYQAPPTSHRNRYSLVLYSPSHHFRYHHMLFFL